jgi:hypothetical protein
MLNQRSLYLSLAVLAGTVLALSWPRAVFSTPAISSAIGDFGPGGLVQVSGSNFGSEGPTILLFDDFEDVPIGESISLNSPTIGAWTERNLYDPVAYGTGRSGSRSFLAWHAEKQVMRQLMLVMPEKHRDIHISYWVRLAPNTYFPGTNWPDGRMPNTFPWDSSWKFNWLVDQNGWVHDDGLYDICLPTHTGRGQFQLAGNSAIVTNRYPGNSWWDWDGWMRMSFSVRDALKALDDEHMQSTFVSDKGHFTQSHAAIANQPDAAVGLVEHQFSRVNFPGWIRAGSGGDDVAPLYDDIYIAVGPGASARIELADAPAYEQSRHIELLLVESWSPNQVNARVPRAVDMRSDGDVWYLFVTDAQGRRNSTGIPVETCLECPETPDPVGVQ